ncbi:hypothetical protein QYE76_062575 [Lolium multiflorum]|uniref:Nitrate transporter n=1 Tax=Lolium multiflorum TaxID=4521 RepID=A0AAD8S412_LOLMU|nr:hypothetical protein QYE76_062575 [Lolium multiflorum]
MRSGGGGEREDEEAAHKLKSMDVNKLEKGGNGSSSSDEDSPHPPRPAVKYHGWRAMPFIIGNETFEKLGTLGTSANLLVYLTQVFHMQSVDAATLLNGLNGTSSLAPIVGAFLSDAYLGRYLALAIATIASLIHPVDTVALQIGGWDQNSTRMLGATGRNLGGSLATGTAALYLPRCPL